MVEEFSVFWANITSDVIYEAGIYIYCRIFTVAQHMIFTVCYMVGAYIRGSLYMGDSMLYG